MVSPVAFNNATSQRRCELSQPSECQQKDPKITESWHTCPAIVYTLSLCCYSNINPITKRRVEINSDKDKEGKTTSSPLAVNR